MSAQMPVWHLRWTYDGHLAGCGISCDNATDACATAGQLRLLASSAPAAQVCPECLALVEATPRSSVPAAVATVLAAVLFMTLLGCGMYTVTHRDVPAAEPSAPSPTGERAEPQEIAR
ncbi:hypothetical protein ACFVJS_04020 [Nocardioides sp. NPDC057772]|uniref:hypothetical protein n=1 Tax=Nocardioides sp. NPDC057772 TaxID=3346245 RepID=UPI00366AA2F5